MEMQHNMDKLSSAYDVFCFTISTKKTEVYQPTPQKVYSELSITINWYEGSSSAAMGKVKRIVTSARRLGCTAPSLVELYHDLMEKKCKHIQSDPYHPLSSNFEELPSESKLRTIYCRTERFRKSFVPSAVRHLNA